MLKLAFLLASISILLGSSAKNMLPNIQAHCTKPSTITLTFDDGVSENLKSLLDILNRENVKATFFVIGNTLQNPYKRKILTKAYIDGHTIANHTWTHPRLTRLTAQQIELEIRNTQNGINQIGRSKRLFFRPPYGEINQKIYSTITKLGYTVVLWNLDAKDWNLKIKKNQIWGNITKNTNQKHSYILLQHDRRLESIELVSDFIKYAKMSGFAIVPLDECLSAL